MTPELAFRQARIFNVFGEGLTSCCPTNVSAGGLCILMVPTVQYTLTPSHSLFCCSYFLMVRPGYVMQEALRALHGLMWSYCRILYVLFD